MASTDRRILGRTGLSLTQLGFGGGPVGWLDTPDAGATAHEVLEAAWNAGVRYFDTAPLYGYGRSERRVGRFLREKPRDDFVISTKVGRLIRPAHEDDRSSSQVVYDYSYDGAMRSMEESLARLGLDRVDIGLIHDIDGWTHGAEQPRRFGEAIEGAYRALSELKSQGLIRAIGLGVNEWRVCEDFARQVPTDCFLLAGRHTLLQREASERFIPFCEEAGLGLIIGGPYNSGILATGPIPGALYDYAPASSEIAAKAEGIQTICAGFGVALPSAALAFPLLSPAVATIIPGSANAAELRATVAHANASIPPSLWGALKDAGFILRT